MNDAIIPIIKAHLNATRKKWKETVGEKASACADDRYEKEH
ncbi:hypothetical protein [Parascardovia denticolens]|nr:hypothetical protein [Parascardovia denticolens]